jgi:hypothetical protein
MAIDKLYWLCCEASSLGPSQTERRITCNKSSDVKRTLDNPPFGWASKVAIFCYPWWVVILFINRLRSHLIAGWRTIRWKGKTHDSWQTNDGHNCIDSPRFYIVEIFPKRKRKPFNAAHYIENIMQSNLKLRPESVQHRLVIHADNTRPIWPSSLKNFVSKILWESPPSVLLS